MYNQKIAKEITAALGLHPEHCMRCGKCSASCPSFGEMDFPPHLFVYLMEKGDMETLMKSDSLYHCLNCLACVERCPRGIEPGHMVELLRDILRINEGNMRFKAAELMARASEEIPQQALTCVMRKFAE